MVRVFHQKSIEIASLPATTHDCYLDSKRRKQVFENVMSSQSVEQTTAGARFGMYISPFLNGKIQ